MKRERTAFQKYLSRVRKAERRRDRQMDTLRQSNWRRQDRINREFYAERSLALAEYEAAQKSSES